MYETYTMHGWERSGCGDRNNTAIRPRHLDVSEGLLRDIQSKYRMSRDLAIRVVELRHRQQVNYRENTTDFLELRVLTLFRREPENVRSGGVRPTARGGRSLHDHAVACYGESFDLNDAIERAISHLVLYRDMDGRLYHYAVRRSIKDLIRRERIQRERLDAEITGLLKIMRIPRNNIS